MKISIVILGVLWVLAALSSLAFPWYLHTFPFLAMGLLLIKWFRSRKAKLPDDALESGLASEHRYII